MKLPRYPKYKDSGVKWLGQVPEHWAVTRMKWAVTACKNGVWGNEAQQDEDDIPCVRVADFDRNRINVKLNDPTIRNVPKKDRVGRALRRGNLLLEKSGGGEQQPVGCVVLYDDDAPAVCSNFIARVEIAPKMNASYWRYVHAAAYSVRLNIRSINQTSGIQNLDQTRYFNEQAAFPPSDEQNSIAVFLGHETGKIDLFIDEQQRLIELLKEKRQAIISHAVTKGLNPDAPMKPSGVKWLGEVPASWKVCLLKRAFRSIEYGISDAVGADGSIAILRMGNIVNGKIDYTDLKYIDSVDRSLLLQEEDLLYNRTNSLDQIGKVGLFHGDIEGQFSFASYLVRLRTVSDSLPEFFAYLLNTENILGLSRASAFVAIGQCNLNPSRYGRIIVTIPPKAEQSEIVRYLDKATSRIDNLIADASRAIDLLQERRSALISAAVTGRIDVRGERNAVL